MKESNFKRLSDIEHVLKRTGMYVGCTNHTKQNMFILNENDEMEYKEVSYVPALIKVIREIIDNSCDEHTRTNGKYAKNIKINCTEDGWISVEDDGRGIPVKKLDDGIWIPESAWSELRAGTNFEDEIDNTTIGQNGLGASISCILSKEFHGTTVDGSHKFKMICKNNLTDKEVKVTPNTGHYTEVNFLPDYSRFDLPNGIDELHKLILKTDIANIAMCFPTITFHFNGKKVNGKSFDKYLEQFRVSYESYEDGNLSIAMLSNETDDFNCVHYINGANVYEGGNPFNGILDHVYDNLKDRIASSRKLKDVKKGDLKNKTTFVLFVRNLPNPRFDSQAKTKCNNSASEVKGFIDANEMEKFIKKIAKNNLIIDPIVDALKMKEDLKELKSLSTLEGKKRFKCEKFLAPIKENKYLALVEGDSAMGGISAALGRDHIGYYALKGIPLNVLDVNVKKMIENNEFSNIIQILGLKISDKTSKDCSFANILLATDNDLDGFHIRGILITFFSKYCQWLLDDKRIKILKTPMIVLKQKDKIIKFFFNFNEYNEYCQKYDILKYDLKYVKGLGSFKKDELKQLLNENGLDYFIDTLNPDEETHKIINNWLGKDNSDIRKEMLRNNKFNIFNI